MCPVSVDYLLSSNKKISSIALPPIISFTIYTHILTHLKEIVALGNADCKVTGFF